MVTRGMLVMLVAAVITSCAPAVQKEKLPKMGVDFAFEQKHKCQGASPEIRLSNIPAGVTTYEITMTDLDVPTFHHWSQTVPAKGSVIPEGTVVGYFGPCPPSGTHRYQIEVVARDAQRNPLAYGEKTVVTGR